MLDVDLAINQDSPLLKANYRRNRAALSWGI